MGKISGLLEKEMTRKQFVLAMISACLGLTGISAFLGAFTKNIDVKPSGNPGYGDRGYGP